MNKYILDVSSYFEYLCTTHPDLLHEAGSGSRVFAVKPLEEAFSDFRTGNSNRDYAVRLVVPTFTGGGSSQAYKQYQTGLLVMKRYSLREDPAQAAISAASEAEAVFDDLIARILHDSQEGLPLFGGFNQTMEDLQLNGDYYFVEGDGSWAGVFATFNLKTPRTVRLDCTTVAWTDGGVTPP